MLQLFLLCQICSLVDIRNGTVSELDNLKNKFVQQALFTMRVVPDLVPGSKS